MVRVLNAVKQVITSAAEPKMNFHVRNGPIWLQHGCALIGRPSLAICPDKAEWSDSERHRTQFVQFEYSNLNTTPPSLASVNTLRGKLCPWKERQNQCPEKLLVFLRSLHFFYYNIQIQLTQPSVVCLFGFFKLYLNHQHLKLLRIYNTQQCV